MPRYLATDVFSSVDGRKVGFGANDTYELEAVKGWRTEILFLIPQRGGLEMKSVINFVNVKKIMQDRYQIKLLDWCDFEARRSMLVGKSSHRHPNDSLEGLDDQEVAKLFADLAASYGGGAVAVSGVSCDNIISPNPFLFVVNPRD